jgi:localization factor PodJL
MNARTSWSAKQDRRSTENTDEGGGPAMPLDDILDARFDEAGRLSQVGRGPRQRTAERLDPRPPAISADELERAVRKLALGLESIERQGVGVRPQEPHRPAAAEPPAAGQGRDFVTYSLDRLEARLEALSKRLEQRAGSASHDEAEAAKPGNTAAPDDRHAQHAPPHPAQAPDVATPEDWHGEPSFAVEPRRGAQADADLDRLRFEAAEAELRGASAEAERLAAAAEAERITAAAEAERRIEAAEAARRAEVAEAERRAAAAEAALRAEAAEARRRAELAEAERRAEVAAAELRAEAAEARRRAEAAREAEAHAELRRQVAILAGRVEALQQNGNGEEIAELRSNLHEVLQHIGDIGRDGHSIAGAVAQIRARLDAMEPKVNAARNMAGNRLGELQDRLSGLTERLGDMEAEIPGFDAVRENQTAILERFDRIEGMVHRLASPEDLSQRIDVLRGELQTVASQPEVARIGAEIIGLAERLEALPGELSDRPVLERIEAQLQALAAEFTETRRERDSGAADLDRHLSELSAALKGIGELGRAPDLPNLDVRLADLMARLDQDRRASGETLARLDKRLAGVAAAVEKQEGEAAAEILAGITQKMDALAGAIEAQDVRGARRDLEGLDRKLDQLSSALTDQAEHLSRRQMEPLEERFDRMQAQLEEIARAQASAEQFGPFAQQLQDIAERVSSLDLGGDLDTSPITARLAAIEDRLAGLGKASDSRSYHNQLEGIISRLELLKGRSIDPARLNDLLDRLDATLQGGLGDDRFDRLERKLDGIGTLPQERFARLEEMLGTGAQAGLADERFARLEQKLDDFGAAIGVGPEVLTQEDLAELRNDIIALRRELRSLPGLGEGESSLGAVLQTIAARLERLPDEPPATTAELEAQIDRIAQLLEDPTHSRLALAHIEASLHAISERLDETRRSMLYRAADPDGEAGESAIGGVADLARSLSDDVTVLKSATQASERKTRDALEAVQGTLEAVVKRMAFLERDAEPPAGAAPGVVAAAAEPAYPVVPGAAGQAPGIVAEHAGPALPRESGSASLFSRLTSSQLLRRATGGRADSFSPDTDDSDDADLPLEPGTDGPLNSALTGAPSSDTALMSGDRSKGRAATGGRNADLEPSRARRSPSEPVAGDDFLAAARRAAQAAAAEVAEAEREAEETRETSGLGRVLGFVRGRRRTLLASALAVAVAFAALQIIRGIVDADRIEIAARPTPAITEQAPVPVAAPPAPAPVVAAKPVAAPAARTEPVAAAAAPASRIPQESRKVPAAPAVAAPLAAPAPATTASLQTSLGDPAGQAAPAVVSLRAPGGSAVPQPATRPLPVSLPDVIGPDRLRNAAVAGDAVAAFEVAARYAEGRGVGQDLGAAIAWYEHAGEAGLAPAQYRLGSIYEKGLGVSKDLVKAQEWYRRAADAGNAKAMHNLAVLYAEGAGGEPDLERAAALFRQAAQHGVRDSQFNLAILHARGLGVPQDMLEAYKWFAIAASSGDAESVKRRDIVAAALSEAELARGKAAAEAFEPLPLVPEANDVAMPDGGWGQETTSVELLSENDRVALVQKLLADKGFDPGPADGLLGEQTIQAIGAFQAQAGLRPTGQIDDDLVAALKGQST